jgi:hypothetical protein
MSLLLHLGLGPNFEFSCSNDQDESLRGFFIGTRDTESTTQLATKEFSRLILSVNLDKDRRR